MQYTVRLRQRVLASIARKLQRMHHRVSMEASLRHAQEAVPHGYHRIRRATFWYLDDDDDDDDVGRFPRIILRLAPDVWSAARLSRRRIATLCN
jgi:hypothetical protein